MPHPAQQRRVRFLAVTSLAAAGVVAAACSSFSSASPPSPDPDLDAGEEAAALVVGRDAEDPVDAGSDGATICEMIAFDLAAPKVGQGWSQVSMAHGGKLEIVDGGVHAYVVANVADSYAQLGYRVQHRETITRATFTAQIAGVAKGMEPWPSMAMIASDDEVVAGTLRVLRTKDNGVRAELLPARGAAVPLVSAPTGSFPDVVPFKVVLTVSGPWSTGPTMSLVSGTSKAMDDPTSKVPALPEPDAGAHVLDIVVGVLAGPSEGASLRIETAAIEICRGRPGE